MQQSLPGSPAAASHPAIARTAAQFELRGVTTGVERFPRCCRRHLVLQAPWSCPRRLQSCSFPVAGAVRQVLVGAGQRVKAGEPVARACSPELVVWQRRRLQARRGPADREAARDAAAYRASSPGCACKAAAPRMSWPSTMRFVAFRQTCRQRREHQQACSGLTAARRQRARCSKSPPPPGQRLDAGCCRRVARGGQWAIALQATPEQAVCAPAICSRCRRRRTDGHRT